jgi:beta-mannanase
VALGAWVYGFPVDSSAMPRYIDLAGRPPAIAHAFQNWQASRPFDLTAAAAAAEIGAAPMISWQPGPSLRAIADGAWDAFVRAAAATLADDGRPLLLRFAHEMNLPGIPWFGPPDEFRAAWLHVRRLFDEAGADNVRWVWSPYIDEPGDMSLDAWFPGREAVDWLALDGYNWGRRRWRNRWASFDRIFAPSLATLDRLAPGLPVMLAEIGCAQRGGDKAGWLRDAFLHAIPRYPEIRAVVWFHEDRPEHADWRVDSSPSALQAWREIVTDPRYAVTGSELLANL